MKKNRLNLLLLPLAIALFLLGGCCEPAMVGSQAVALKPQETNNWCWAATTQMINTFLGKPIEQCTLANMRFGRTDCCQGTCPKNAACNMPGWTMFAETNMNFNESNSPLSWDDLKKQIYCTKKPMAYAYGPKSGGVGHVLVIYGYAEVGTSKYLYLKDPWAPCAGNDRFITYNEYSNSGTTDHWRTIYNITPKP